MPKKEPAQIVNQPTSAVTDLREITNNVFDAAHVKNDLFGNVTMLKNVMNSLGFDSGFKKAILFGDFQSFPVTALSKSSKSKIIGLINFQFSTPTFHKLNTFFTTARILAKTTVLSLL